MQAGGRRFDPVWLHQSGFRLVQTNEIRVRRTMDLRELKARENCFERVISDIVKRRSFRVSIVVFYKDRGRYALPAFRVIR